MRYIILVFIAMSLWGQKVNYQTDIKLAPFAWDKANSIWKPGGVTGDTNLVRFSGYEGPPTWPALDSPYIFGRKITTSSDVGNFKNTVSIIQHSFFLTGTPAALYVQHDSDIQSSYGTTAIYGRFNKRPSSADISIALHGEVFCDDCGGAAIGVNSEVALQSNSSKPVELFGQVLQSGLLATGVTTHAHSVVGQKILVHYPVGQTNPQGGILIEPGSGTHAYGLKITQYPTFGSIFSKAIDADGDIDLNTNHFIRFNRPSTDAFSVSGIKFYVDGALLSTIGVDNSGAAKFSSGIISTGDITVNTGQKINFNRSSAALPTVAGVDFKVDGVLFSTLGVDNDKYVTATYGVNQGTNTLANISLGGANGAIVYCSNCNTPATPGASCATSGDMAGAMAMRVRGAWKCY